MALLLRDLRTAARSLRRHPWESLLAASALAFGLGLSATLFAVARAAYLRGLPLPEAERIVGIERLEPEDGHLFGAVSLDELLEWRRAQHGFEGLVAWAYGNVTLRAPGAAARHYTLCRITADAFTVLGIQPALGRGLLAGNGEPGAARVVVLSDRVWNEQFARAPSVLGRRVQLGDESAEIVGVLGPEQRFPFNQDLWTPLDPTAPGVLAWSVQVAGRLRPGITPAVAAAELTALARVRSPRATAVVTPFTLAPTRELRDTVHLLRAAAVLVLLLAAANVSHLLIARGLIRRQEIAVRAALGASRRRLAATALGEAVAVAALGTGLGLALAAAGTAWLARAGRPWLWMYWIDLRLDLPTVAVTAALGAATALAAAALPAWAAQRTAPAAILQQEGTRVGSRRLGWTARVLVILQVATCAVLLIASALLWLTLRAASRIDAGRDPDHVLAAQIFAPNAEGAKLMALLPRFEDALLADPAVVSVGEATDLPGGGSRALPLHIDGAAGPAFGVATRFVGLTSQAPATLGMDLLAGRPMTAADDEATSAPAAWVNRSLADRDFPDGAIGKRLRHRSSGPWRTVVGIFDDTVWGSPEASLPCVYTPLGAESAAYLQLVIRTRTPPDELAARLPKILAAAGPDVVVSDVLTLPQRLDAANTERRFLSTAFAVFAAGAVTLALLGLYGLLAFNVRSGRRELGIRAALGAGREKLFAFVCMRGAHDLALGLGLGAAVAAGGVRLLDAYLLGVSPWDFAAWCAALGVVLVGGLASCALPAWRAARLEPAAALRED